MDGPACCVECFNHDWVRGYVREVSEQKGDCDYCEAEGVDVVGIEALAGPFNNLLGLFVRSNDEHGDPLIELVQGEHELFADDLYDSGEAARLLGDILECGWDDDSGAPPVDVNEDYHVRSRAWFHATWFDAWQNFCEDVRQDPAHEPSLPELLEDELVRIEVVLPQGTVLYRARPGFDGDGRRVRRPYGGAQIGAPPPEKARAGRANAKGEVVLYVADQEATAVAEVRPWRGLNVSVAELRAARDLRIVDLSKEPPPSNPFTDEAPQYQREIEELLAAFGEELSRPVRRADDPLDYVPCQKLVRRIRRSGWCDGIRYPSAMAPGGTNLVLFDPAVADIGASKLIEVGGVRVTYGPADGE